MVSIVPVGLTPTRIIPGSDEGGYRAMLLAEPFVNPPGTFRANTVTEMYEITPNPLVFSSFIFDVGIDPKIDPVVFTVQNRTVNVRLSIILTLPNYLQSDLAAEFSVPFINEPDTDGLGITTVTLSFNEEVAKTFNPDTRIDTILFDVFPVGTLVGPVFVLQT